MQADLYNGRKTVVVVIVPSVHKQWASTLLQKFPHVNKISGIIYQMALHLLKYSRVQHSNAAIHDVTAVLNDTIGNVSLLLAWWHQTGNCVIVLHTSELCSSADDCCEEGETVSHLRGSSVLVTPDTHTDTHTRLTALFPGPPGWAGTRKVKPIWILLKQETASGSGIGCMQVCTSLQTDNHASNPPLSIKALKG